MLRFFFVLLHCILLTSSIHVHVVDAVPPFILEPFLQGGSCKFGDAGAVVVIGADVVVVIVVIWFLL